MYAASKLALRFFAPTWLNELKVGKNWANVLLPGAIVTPMQEEVLAPEANQYFETLTQGKGGLT